MNFFRRFHQLPRDFKVIFVVLLLVTIVSLSYAITKGEEPARTAAVSPDAATLEMQKIVSELGTSMILPDEVPTLATVSNPEVLKNQPFFANAVAGDKVLIFTKAHKAILWRPSAHKIVEVSELDVNSIQQR